MSIDQQPSEAPSRELLKQLLSERNQYPERAAAIDAKVFAIFSRKIAILALDMCGFSRATEEHGIVHFLAMIHQMEQAAVPAITGNGGQVIKQEADNLFAIFVDPVHALEAALDIFRAFNAMNAVRPDERDIFGSIGIGFGNTLIIDDHDLFGHEMNTACKLGEDLAKKMEILLTPAAYEALPEGHYQCVREDFVAGGIDLQSYRFEKSWFPRPRRSSA